MPITSIANVDQDALNLKDFLEGVLERVITVFQSYNVPLPTRQYWTVGEAAIDCEQLVVTLMQVYLGPPGTQQNIPQRCNMPITAVVGVMLARQIPVVSQNGRPPEAAKISEGAEISAVDAWVMMKSLNLFDMWEEGGYGLGVIASVETIPPAGGFQVVALQLTMAVP